MPLFEHSHPKAENSLTRSVIIGILFLCLIPLLMYILRPGHVAVSIANASSASIIGGQLKIGRDTYNIPSLNPGRTYRFGFRYWRIQEYCVDIQTSGGQTLRSGGIYIDREFPIKDNITLSDSGLFVDRGAGPIDLERTGKQ